MQKAACVYFELSETTFYKGATPCGNTVDKNPPHGFLCHKHKVDNLESTRVYKGNVVRDVDAEIVRSIIISERRAIAKGVRRNVRFGALQPEYIHYLEA